MQATFAAFTRSVNTCSQCALPSRFPLALLCDGLSLPSVLRSQCRSALSDCRPSGICPADNDPTTQWGIAKAQHPCGFSVLASVLCSYKHSFKLQFCAERRGSGCKNGNHALGSAAAIYRRVTHLHTRGLTGREQGSPD